MDSFDFMQCEDWAIRNTCYYLESEFEQEPIDVNLNDTAQLTQENMSNEE